MLAKRYTSPLLYLLELYLHAAGLYVSRIYIKKLLNEENMNINAGDTA